MEKFYSPPFNPFSKTVEVKDYVTKTGVKVKHYLRRPRFRKLAK